MPTRLLTLALAIFLGAGCTTARMPDPVPAPPPVADVPAPGEVDEPPVLLDPPDRPGIDPPPPIPLPDTATAGRFDYGKMWTFEAPPRDWLREAYGFTPSDDWFDRARLSALRVPGCSASFVSADGLVATNHHCARGSVVAVTRDGENLLDNGFVAPALADERPIADYYVDQMIAIDDVTAEVDAALEDVVGADARGEMRRRVMAGIEQRMQAERGDGYVVQVVSLYNGGRFSAYTFRRYTDVRLVMAPEEQMGYFGGDWDNFTYPRYALDFAFYRVYGDDGEPLDTANHFFRWSTTGVDEGDLVFVIGNPGSTNRLESVAQLEWRRDVQVPTLLGWLGSRADAIRAYLAETPDDDAIRNRLFGLLNAEKAYGGRRAALADPYILARKRAAERDFRVALSERPTLARQYTSVLPSLEGVQADKQALGAEYRAFQMLLNQTYASSLLRRAATAYKLLFAQRNGADAATLDALETALATLTDRPGTLERELLTAEIEDVRAWQQATGQLDNVRLMAPGAFAQQLLADSRLATQAATQQALADDALSFNDPALNWLTSFYPALAQFQDRMETLASQESDLSAQLGRARYAIYGTAVPPDATFSLRFSDGIVKGYPYNGTLAPPKTTFYGLYDHYYSYGPDTAWRLPAKWLPAPPSLDLSTPMNFPTTSDTIGGNSGSPMITPEQELVGLNFDRTIEGLLRDYIYLPNRGRNVAVDSRAILAALDHVYNLDRLVDELKHGGLREH